MLVANDKKSTGNVSDMASELKNLLSPEKALHLLHSLLDKNPILWRDLNDILHPNNNNNITNDTCEDANIFISNVLRNLRQLQLSELPLEILCTITQFLPLKSCLSLCETSSFFSNIIPKYIDIIHLDQDITESVYKLFSKSERLKYLTIDGTYKCLHLKILFAFPFAKLKSLKELYLVNVKFEHKNETIYKFTGGTYSLCDLQLDSVSNINVNTWIKLTSSKHCPNLTNISIRPSSNICTDNTINEFAKQIMSSKCHSQIRNLCLNIYNINILKTLRMNQDFIGNLYKFEIGLIDKQEEHDQQIHNVNISVIFQTLFCIDNRNYYSFRKLEMLLIDFCPNSYSQGYNDISPIDLSNFIQNMPQLCPSLKLLALYGSMNVLLFNDDHLNSLLYKTNNIVIPQIIDLSIGFEDMSSNVDNLIIDIMNTFPNLAWLTLQNEQLLLDQKRFHKIVDDSLDTIKSKSYDNLKLKWITLCNSEKDAIYESSNGMFIEYWQREIQDCDFDAALHRSQQLSSSKT
eukprot:332785_1